MDYKKIKFFVNNSPFAINSNSHFFLRFPLLLSLNTQHKIYFLFMCYVINAKNIV